MPITKAKQGLLNRQTVVMGWHYQMGTLEVHSAIPFQPGVSGNITSPN
jgi:hypothetical protein